MDFEIAIHRNRAAMLLMTSQGPWKRRVLETFTPVTTEARIPPTCASLFLPCLYRLFTPLENLQGIIEPRLVGTMRRTNSTALLVHQKRRFYLDFKSQRLMFDYD